MKRGKTKALQAIVEAKYAIERNNSAAILQKEASLRSALAKLRAQADEAERVLSEDLDTQMAGSGPLWQAWATRKRLELQSEMARIAADRERAVRNLKKAFGRRQAIASAVQQIEIKQRDANARRNIALLLDPAISGKRPVRTVGQISE